MLEPYFVTTDTTFLGHPNLQASRGNPLKGLVGGIRWAPPPLPEQIPLSIEFFNIGLKEVMVGDKEFDWSGIDGLLEGSASRRKHVVFSPYIHWPGQELQLPEYLVGRVRMIPTNDDNGPSPDYGDPLLLLAIEQFIQGLAERFDGDKRIAAIHVGLLGFWGEFHTYPFENILPESSKDCVLSWYSSSFSKTQLQARYPRASTCEKFGYHDDSFCYSTVDGEANGGVEQGWFFVPQLCQYNESEAWKGMMMGGETYPALQPLVFQQSYKGGSEFRQDFRLCTETIHATYMIHHDAFQNDGYSPGNMLDNALSSHDALGYNFCISRIAVTEAAENRVDVSVCITQIGVAPFYYDLSLLLCAEGLLGPLRVDGIEKLLVERDASHKFTFESVPETCLESIEFRLTSSYLYHDRPVRFAQGVDGLAKYSLPTRDALDFK